MRISQFDFEATWEIKRFQNYSPNKALVYLVKKSGNFQEKYQYMFSSGVNYYNDLRGKNPEILNLSYSAQSTYFCFKPQDHLM